MFKTEKNMFYWLLLIIIKNLLSWRQLVII